VSIANKSEPAASGLVATRSRNKDASAWPTSSSTNQSTTPNRGSIPLGSSDAVTPGDS